MLENCGGRRLLVVNVYYAPTSFGGATVVAESMARQLVAQHGWNVLVVTTFHDAHVVPYTMKRYVADGIDVIGVCIPYSSLRFDEFHANSQFDGVFLRIVESFRPDVAHVHCVQSMGATFFGILEVKRIPFAVTMHDCWWFCERQFMMTGSGNYCHQTKIDLGKCRFCVTDIRETRLRRNLLYRELERCSMMLFPSEYFRNFAVENGLPGEKCKVNRNGVRRPGSTYSTEKRYPADRRIRFGFVGGPGENKGSHLFIEAFRQITRTDYELVLVDAAQNHGRSWQGQWKVEIPGEVRFRAAYNMDSLDSFYSEIDVLLFPSQWKETFGLTVREALIRDIWVVVTDAGALTEDCVDNINSSIIPMESDCTNMQKTLELILESFSPEDFRNPLGKKITTEDVQASQLSLLLSGLGSSGLLPR